LFIIKYRLLNCRNLQWKVVETHQENVVDLRLDAPVPELEAYAQTFDFDAMDNTDHGHIPYLIILLKYLGQWKKEVCVIIQVFS
jgi:hypothetical protein